jgi:hypothetical protein
MRSYYSRVLQTKFTTWLNEPVWVDQGLYKKRRQQMFYEFIWHLVGFMKANRYICYANEEEIAHDFVRLCFSVHTQRPYKYIVNGDAEDRTQFHDVFTSEKGEEFWNQWDDFDEFSLDTKLGSYVRSHLFVYMWQFVDISALSMTLRTDDESDHEEPKFNARGRVDPYLLDQAHTTSKYGRWE